ncbi:plasmid stability protein StbB [Allostella sp. ATCC 35155]|nr:plasmid stability protein StbB [Stella sp. ATCC 35155]
MTRYLLDTNIVSHATKAVPSRPLVDWLEAQADEDLHIATMTVAEIQRGILLMPTGRRRRLLEDWFGGREGILTLFSGRILAFDGRAALVWARLMAEGTSTDRPRSAIDMIIAAVAEVNECVVVTANERDFAGIPFVNPVRAGA